MNHQQALRPVKTWDLTDTYETRVVHSYPATEQGRKRAAHAALALCRMFGEPRYGVTPGR